MPKVGSRRQVWEGSSERTSGGLRKSDLTKNEKTGRIVSKAKRRSGQRMWSKNRADMLRMRLAWAEVAKKHGVSVGDAMRSPAMASEAKRLYERRA